MNKLQKSLIALLAVCLLFFGFVVVRIGVAKPASAVKVAAIPAGEMDPAVWGKYYPLQYASYQKTAEGAPSPTGYGGSVLVQKSQMQPEMLTLFKGMPFSKDYAEDRGHIHAMEDLRETKRIGPASKGACITCKTPYVEQAYKEHGWDYANKPLTEMMDKAKFSVACSTCHDPATMNLRVINPAFIEAQAARGIDVTKASREDMRSFVCAQCHSEYYFEPGTTKVVFPWDKGLKPAEMYAYYSETPRGFVQDWQHPDSQAAMLKAQHPDYELFSTGNHGTAGVSCADCHMPYTRKDGQKYTSHWVTSPLKTLDDSCTPCHNQGTAWLQERVKTIQDQTFELQHMAGQNIVKAHQAIQAAAAQPGADQAGLAKARELVRKAQFYWDLLAAENSMGFHNPSQALNTLGQANELAHQAIEAANTAAGIKMF
ncbi:ammonia-forming cytochrome c nitrite reductase subunit c552 [Sporomusa sphaeroides]|uniref:nitrite reductase (cytochrome; ammonia-forming) n=2 Tax=Sporomusa TaxID=2375 RepID=A0ABP2CAU0_9FIRM|nr:ammonia-forming cytochrome c nitrite reductase subunit c552 [Sporomusa sphaeroides]OLS55408.1 cytochrome c-552 precursor [Sporomusa sphaeroides DSM 2875]CVK21434.1 Cytochrome c-552 precursor [Sporomusa sphaeroides DSM 2875]SCM83502.1 Cytochrome c-552 [uncultured Sporomusa sp.]